MDPAPRCWVSEYHSSIRGSRIPSDLVDSQPEERKTKDDPRASSGARKYCCTHTFLYYYLLIKILKDSVTEYARVNSSSVDKSDKKHNSPWIYYNPLIFIGQQTFIDQNT